jgi:peptide/nickel transport system permease protein
MIGGLLGAIAGFYGGLTDSSIVRTMDTVMCIPLMLLVLSIVAALGASLVNVLIAMMIANVPHYTRIVRAAVLSVVGQDYIEAAKACGTPDFWIIIKHVIPNAIGPIIVQATMAVGVMIINAAGISFLGMGIQPPTPEWGAMLNEAKNYMINYPYTVIFPGLSIGLTALSLNLMGDGLRDALDPKLKD